jgi:hypothetical protein
VPGSERFLEVALATAERTYQGLAWEANARVPLAAWRIHATAAELYARAANRDLVGHYRELSRATIMKLADSLDRQILFARHSSRRDPSVES